MDQREIESRVVALLQRFASLDYAAVRRFVLMDGNFSGANEAVLKLALADLVERGVLRAPGGPFGPYLAAPPAVLPGDSPARARLRR